MSTDALGDLNDTYMHINYSGDKAEICNGHTLSNDDYNSHATQTVGLNRQEHSVEEKELTLMIYKLDKDGKTLFGLPANGTNEQAGVKKVEFDFECLQKID